MAGYLWKFDINDFIKDAEITAIVSLGSASSFINNVNGKMTLKYSSPDFF